MAAQQPVQKNTLYVGGLAEEVNESILHAAFIPFGDIKDVKTPLDQATQKHRSFGFVTFLEKEDASAAMDNMDGAELYGRVLTVNYALPEKIKGGEQGWAAQPSMFTAFFFLTLLHMVYSVYNPNPNFDVLWDLSSSLKLLLKFMSRN
ncbi:unnamed protein product [Linum tenue]|uniref:RRM domain-containing protein n=1 Tax=Linum tenue TaxID=586396 RepID=A0AAV0Q772_9ROSI|nr:unnamed protein product [Linum tenue]